MSSVAPASPSVIPADPRELVLPFVESVKSVMKTMLGANCSAGEISRIRGGHHIQEVSAVIGLSGDIIGSLTFCTTNSGAMQILERMTGMEATEVDEFVRDAMGEMANMIAGYGKRELEHLQLRLGLPQVILGQEMMVFAPRWSHHFWIGLDTEVGPCALDIGFGRRPS